MKILVILALLALTVAAKRSHVHVGKTSSSSSPILDEFEGFEDDTSFENLAEEMQEQHEIMKQVGYLDLLEEYELKVKSLESICAVESDSGYGAPPMPGAASDCMMEMIENVRWFKRSYDELPIDENDAPSLMKTARAMAKRTLKMHEDWEGGLIAPQISAFVEETSNTSRMELSQNCRNPRSNNEIDSCIAAHGEKLSDPSFGDRTRRNTEHGAAQMKEEGGTRSYGVPELFIIGGSGSASGGPNFAMMYAVAGFELVYDMHTLEAQMFFYRGAGAGANSLNGGSAGIYAALAVKGGSRDTCVRDAYKGWFVGGDVSVSIPWLPDAGIVGAVSATSPVTPYFTDCVCAGIAVSKALVSTGVKFNLQATYYDPISGTNKYSNAYSFLWYEGNCFGRLADELRSRNKILAEALRAIGFLITSPIAAVLSLGTTANYFTGRNTNCN